MRMFNINVTTEYIGIVTGLQARPKRHEERVPKVPTLQRFRSFLFAERREAPRIGKEEASSFRHTDPNIKY
jgi:hypothetical protein